MEKYIFSISPNRKVLRVTKKIYEERGKRHIVKTSEVLRECSLLHLKTIIQKTTITTAYWHFGYEFETETITEDLYISQDIYNLISKERDLLNITDKDFYFASENMIAKPTD